MITKLIGAMVANGTTTGNWGYAPWLPFYNFFPIVIVATLIVTLILGMDSRFSPARAIVWGSVYLTSSLGALAVVFVLWWKLDLNPGQVLFWWAINLFLLIFGQGRYLHQQHGESKNAD